MCHARSAWWLETKSYARRKPRHRLASLGNTKEKCPLLLSRGGGEIFLEKGKDIFLWCSALKVSGRWRNNVDEVLQKLFFGERILQNFD